MPTEDTNGLNAVSDIVEWVNRDTNNLKLQRNDAEVHKLYGRPEHEIRFQGREIYILELPHHCSPSPSFGDRHECEETR